MKRMCLAIVSCGLLVACGGESNVSEGKPGPEKVSAATKVQSVQSGSEVNKKPVERKLAIQGMTCKGCASSVRTALMSVEGVHEAIVNFEKGEAVIKCDESVTGATLIHQVENYEVGGVKQSFKAQEKAAAEPSAKTNTKPVEHQLAIQGMCCNGCAASVRTALNSIQGVQDVDVSFEKGKAVIKCDESVSAKVLIDTLENPKNGAVKRGYKVQELTL